MKELQILSISFFNIDPVRDVIWNAPARLVGRQEMVTLDWSILRLRYKRVLKQFLSGVPVIRVYHEHFVYERPRIFGYVVGIYEFTFGYLFIEFLVVLASKWELPAEHCEH